MKQTLALVLGLCLWLGGFPLNAAQAKTNVMDKFYGKLVSVDLEHNSFVVSNRRRNLQEQFTWNKETKFIFNQNEVGPKELIANRLLIVHYLNTDGEKNVQKVTIRPPLTGRKKAAADNE